MRFEINLNTKKDSFIPINYQYPLSSAIYKIISKGDSEYASFLHEKGYGNDLGKRYKLFTFSQLNTPFKIREDRLLLTSEQASFQVSFHLPKAMENFIKGLFQSENIEIADKKSKACFSVKSIVSVSNRLHKYDDSEIISTKLKALSPVVVGLLNDKEIYDFLAPGDNGFCESLIFNWRNKIASCYDKKTASSAILIIDVEKMETPPKSRLISIKSGTPQETKIRGWMNFILKATAENRFVDLLLNCGAGLYNAQGMGFVEIIE